VQDKDRLEQQANDNPDQPEAEDAEGHMFLPHDSGTARSLAQGRSADIERQAKERQREKEARPNRRS